MALHYRQGDILLLEVSAIPLAAQEDRSGSEIVLAYGERTGHKHVVKRRAVRCFRDSGQIYLDIRRGAALTHEEHAPIILPPGMFRVVQQRQYLGRDTDADQQHVSRSSQYGQSQSEVDYNSWDYACD